MFNIREWNKQANIVADILSKAPKFDKDLRVDREEFERRQKTLYQKLKEAGFDGGIVYSDEHYHGDVPYLGGNTNISVEPVAGIIGVNGFSILAGLEGCYVAEQLSKRSGCRVGRVEMLKLADEEYPVEVERLENVVEDICGGKPKRIALLTSRSVMPVSIYEWFEDYVGKGNLVDAQEIYYKLKYEKSDKEMILTRQAAKISDFMIEGMLAVMRPGMLETQVPAKISNFKSSMSRGKKRYLGPVDGKDLVIVADGVAEPKKLRYLYSEPWFGSLYSEAGLPVGAFHIGD